MNRAVLAAVIAALLIGGAYLFLQDRRTGDGQDGADAASSELATLLELQARLAAKESAVARMTASQAILDNEMEYSRGLDRHDESLVGSVFWPDAELLYGSRVTIPDLPAWVNASHANRAAHQHHVTTLSLDIDGDTAHMEGYILFSSDIPRDKSFDTPGAPTPGRATTGSFASVGTGRYINRYERRDGEWRIIVHDYVHEAGMLLKTVDLCATSCLGRWDQSDISYLRPLQPLTAEERQRGSELGKAPHARGETLPTDRSSGR